MPKLCVNSSYKLTSFLLSLDLKLKHRKANRMNYKKILGVFLFITSISPAFADQSLATKNGCTACHASDKKIIGPAFQDIAKKYSGDTSAIDKMAQKIKTGGKGVWGPVPMPAHPQISDADLRNLAAWALKGGPAK